MTDYYEILGIPKEASPEDIRSAFRERSCQVHPDKPDGSVEDQILVNEAYGVLSDPIQRERYDSGASVKTIFVDKLAYDWVFNFVGEQLTFSGKVDLSALKSLAANSKFGAKRDLCTTETELARLKSFLPRIQKKEQEDFDPIGDRLRLKQRQLEQYLEERGQIILLLERVSEILSEYEITPLPEISGEIYSDYGSRFQARTKKEAAGV